MQLLRATQPQRHVWGCLAYGSQALRELAPSGRTSSIGRWTLRQRHASECSQQALCLQELNWNVLGSAAAD